MLTRAAFIRGQHLLFQRGGTVINVILIILIILLRPAMVQAVGTVAGPGALEKESQQLPTMLSVKYLYLLDETFIISALS